MNAETQSIFAVPSYFLQDGPVYRATLARQQPSIRGWSLDMSMFGNGGLVLVTEEVSVSENGLITPLQKVLHSNCVAITKSSNVCSN